MKIFISIYILAVLGFTSCKKDYTELIQKIELTQTALLQQDSILTIQRNELSSLVYNGANAKATVDSVNTALTNLVSKQNALITRLELIIQKNKELIIKLNENSINPNEVYKKQMANADELELMRTEINSATTSYTKIVEQGFKNSDSTSK